MCAAKQKWQQKWKLGTSIMGGDDHLTKLGKLQATQKTLAVKSEYLREISSWSTPIPNGWSAVLWDTYPRKFPLQPSVRLLGHLLST